MDYEKCECNDNWIGLSCESPTCYKVNNCSLNGLCVSPNKCECFEQYDGENCTEKVAANSNTPIFSNGSYFAVVSENRGKDYVVLTVSANDLDHGRSGEISYSIEEANIANFFMIAHESGQIAVAADGVLDYETIIQKQFTFIVTATDNGIPSQRSEANVTIIVKDENDNCPVFKTLPGNYKIPLEIVANDNDYGDNGRIQYSIAEETDPDRKFSISSNGILLANSVLQPGAYSLTIVAQDGGVIPCARELSLTVVVDQIVFVSTSTAIALEISSSLQSSTIALKPSSSVQSSTIALKPSSTLQSSTIALKVSSSLYSSTVALKLSSSLQSSTIALKPSSSLQSSTIALKPSSSLQSSTIALKPTSVQSSTVVPEQSSSLQSSTIALKPTSVQSSTVVPEQSSSLQSSTIALKPTSVQSSTVVPEQSSSLQSSTIALKPTSVQSSTVVPEQSSSLQSSTIALKTSSSLQSSTIALKPTSVQSSTVVPEQSSSLQSSTIALKPTSVQSSTVVPEQSSSLQSSTIALKTSSSLQSSTIALKPTSVQSSTVVPEQSSSLQSSTIALKPASVQSSTVVPEQSSSLQSSTIALKTSSSLQLSTLGQESLSSLDSSTHTYKPLTSLQASTIAFEPSSSVHQSDPIDMVSTNTEQLQPTKTGSAERPTSSTTSNNIVFVRLRLLNIGFVVGYRNKNSIDYKNLRRMVEMTVKDIFEKIEGFLGIFDIDFEQGSVIANIQTEVSSENTQVNTSSLAKAVFDSGDENGRLGELHLDTAFLREQLTPTTPPTTETSNEEDDNDAFIAAGISIGLAALICFALALCLVSINF